MHTIVQSAHVPQHCVRHPKSPQPCAPCGHSHQVPQPVGEQAACLALAPEMVTAPPAPMPASLGYTSFDALKKGGTAAGGKVLGKPTLNAAVCLAQYASYSTTDLHSMRPAYLCATIIASWYKQPSPLLIAAASHAQCRTWPHSGQLVVQQSQTPRCWLVQQLASWEGFKLPQRGCANRERGSHTTESA